MMGIGFPELMIILVIIMIIFGAGKLPEIGSAFGRSIKNFKSSMKEAQEGDAIEGEDNKPDELAEGKPDLENMTEQEKEAYLRKKAFEAVSLYVGIAPNTLKSYRNTAIAFKSVDRNMDINFSITICIAYKNIIVIGVNTVRVIVF